MFNPNTLARVQAALSVGGQVAASVQSTSGGKLPKIAEARLVTEVARIVLEEDERQNHRLIVPRH